ncbi:MAG: endopeptidase La [Phycisphaerae bacterium]|nr:endopeptidase La [Phycisphaerae bacterium]
MTDKADNKPKVITAEESKVVVRPAGSRPATGESAAGEAGSDAGIVVPPELAVLPVRNMVLFPGTVIPLAIGRDRSRHLIETVLPEQKVIVTVCQKDVEVEDPTSDDLYQVGTAVAVVKLLRLEGGNQSIIVHAMSRVRIKQWLGREPFFQARVSVLQETHTPSTEALALEVNARNLAARVVELSPSIPQEAAMVINNIEEPGALADFLAANLQMELSVKQRLLEETEVTERLRQVGVAIQEQLNVLELSQKIQGRVKDSIDKSQQQYFLQEQLKQIQKELGQTDDKTIEIEDLRERIDAAGMAEAIKSEASRELGRLEKIPTASPEYNVIRTYLDWITEVPWSKATKDKLDVNRARRILNQDHYDLEKVKRRILEYLAVRKLAPESRGPILCFVGPPGVGKTSLGQSIARALGRRFIRMSLGGMRDEAELRGHRRTYIGAMPGRIVQEIRKAGTNNPVFMLDELDKVGADFRGDPTSALLEVLDPAQNSTFQDHYLNVPYDLSKVLFIGTANYMAPVSPALRDRMEVIELPGYTQREKMHIAQKYLVKRQLSENGLTAGLARWTAPAIQSIISNYTREAGVRELERQIGTICRSVAAEVVAGKTRSRTITAGLVAKLLGPAKYESELALRASVPGVVTALAYTPTGGDIIFIEATGYPAFSRKGTLTLTGQIGEVMRESAQAALSLIKSSADKLGIDGRDVAGLDIHVHVPAGAVPKDGPSAGIAMFIALTSLLTNRAVRPDVAMTGEITLRGLVLPIGGVKQKVLGAKLAGIKTVILPDRNRKDMPDVPSEAKKGMKFRFVKNVNEVLKIALKAPDDSKQAPARRKRSKTKTGSST